MLGIAARISAMRGLELVPEPMTEVTYVGWQYRQQVRPQYIGRCIDNDGGGKLLQERQGRDYLCGG